MLFWISIKRKIRICLDELKYICSLPRLVKKNSSEILTLSSMQNDVLEIENKMREIREIEPKILHAIHREHINRLKAIKTLKTNLLKEVNRYNKNHKLVERLTSVETRITGFESKWGNIEVVQDLLQKREGNIDGLMSMIRKKITELDNYIDKFSYIESLADEAKKQYNNYLTKLKKDISEFQETDQAVRRLASLETRITQLETVKELNGK